MNNYVEDYGKNYFVPNYITTMNLWLRRMEHPVFSGTLVRFDTLFSNVEQMFRIST